MAESRPAEAALYGVAGAPSRSGRSARSRGSPTSSSRSSSGSDRGRHPQRAALALPIFAAAMRSRRTATSLRRLRDLPAALRFAASPWPARCPRVDPLLPRALSVPGRRAGDRLVPRPTRVRLRHVPGFALDQPRARQMAAGPARRPGRGHRSTSPSTAFRASRVDQRSSGLRSSASADQRREPRRRAALDRNASSAISTNNTPSANPA